MMVVLGHKLVKWAVLAFALAGSANASAASKRFDLVAYDEAAMNPDDRTPVIPDARTRLPKILKSCGVHEFERLLASNGAVAFRFDVAGDRAVTCLRAALPPGAQLMEH